MSYYSGGRAVGGKKGATDNGSSSSDEPTKYCSLLIYLEKKNRELYDVVHDLCLGSFFATRGGREKTFLMPIHGTILHNAIVKAAYGPNPHDAVTLIKTCLLSAHKVSLSDFKAGESIHNAADQSLTVAEVTANKVTFSGDGNTAEITAVSPKEFSPLYTGSRFHVFHITTGMFSTNNPSMRASGHSKEPSHGTDEASGGSWAAMRNGNEAEAKAYASAHALAKSMVDAHIESIGNSSANLPAWLVGGPKCVFARLGVSLSNYLESSKHPLASLWARLIHPNPMSAVLFICLFLDDETYRAWLAHEDVGTDNDYTYAQYCEKLPKKESADDSAEIVKDCTQKVLAAAKMRAVSDCVRSAYAKAYSSMPGGSNSKLLYDEGVFILNSYVRAAHSGNVAEAKKIGDIIIRHYCNREPCNKCILADSSDAVHDLEPGAPLYCKLYEFVLSESFMYPSKFGLSGVPLADWAEPKIKAGGTNALNFSERLKEYWR